MYNKSRKPFRHLEDTLVHKAHRMACAWMWPEDDDISSRSEKEKYHAKVLRALLVDGLRRLEEDGRNPMAVALVDEVLPDVNVMGLIYKRVSPVVSDEAISRCAGQLVMEQLFGPRDRPRYHLVDGEDSQNAYAYGQALEALMRDEVATGKNPLTKSARQLGLKLADLRRSAVSARERAERECLEAQTDAFAAGAPVETASVAARQARKVDVDASLEDGEALGVPIEVTDRYGSQVDAALLG